LKKPSDIFKGVQRFRNALPLLHEVVRSDEPEHDLHRNGEPSPSGVMHDGWCGKPILHAASFKLARPSGDHISDPFASPTVSERNEESLRRSKNIHRCPVDPA